MNKDQIFDRRFGARPFLDRKTEDCPCGFGPAAQQTSEQEWRGRLAALRQKGETPLWYDLPTAGSGHCLFHHDLGPNYYPPAWRELTEKLQSIALMLEKTLGSKRAAREIRENSEYLRDFVETWRDLAWLSPKNLRPIVTAFGNELGDYSAAALTRAKQNRERRCRKTLGRMMSRAERVVKRSKEQRSDTHWRTSLDPNHAGR